MNVIPERIIFVSRGIAVWTWEGIALKVTWPVCNWGKCAIVMLLLSRSFWLTLHTSHAALCNVTWNRHEKHSKLPMFQPSSMRENRWPRRGILHRQSDWTAVHRATRRIRQTRSSSERTWSWTQSHQCYHLLLAFLTSGWWVPKPQVSSRSVWCFGCLCFW